MASIGPAFIITNVIWGTIDNIIEAINESQYFSDDTKRKYTTCKFLKATYKSDEKWREWLASDGERGDGSGYNIKDPYVITFCIVLIILTILFLQFK